MLVGLVWLICMFGLFWLWWFVFRCGMHCVVFGGLLGGVLGCFGLILFVFTCINYALVAVCVDVIWFMLVVVVWCFNCVARCWVLLAVAPSSGLVWLCF